MKLKEVSKTQKELIKLIAEDANLIMFNYLVVNELIKDKDIVTALGTAATIMEKIKKEESQ